MFSSFPNYSPPAPHRALAKPGLAMEQLVIKGQVYTHYACSLQFSEQVVIVLYTKHM